ncbi:DUF2125 domain-containing protein [Pseudaestuariivita atlantica]|uniref:DUF2125 domain-containing protein n=1 Tax=Pseudaestuariivita atlantica TaxID=1317121 RepID=A0A0L1JLI1_9RHOB|nr:DUF2125 domain-containing protein [Pseudaestuariivita atlantica]KNG92609.1 hypothetical protein ATO11_16435 [Pseudaestuariivita atlantica]
MRGLLIAILVAAAAWSGWWAWGWRSQTQATGAWLEARAADGWEVEVADWGVRGFPNRFDLTLEGVALTDPRAGLGWRADRLHIARLSYNLNHRIVTFPATQTLIWPEGRARLDSDRMRASLVTAGDAAQTLGRLTLVADVLNISGDAGAAALARMQLSMRQVADAPEAYDMALTADGFAPRLPRIADATGDALPATFDRLALRGTVSFDRAWDAGSLTGPRPQPVAIDLDQGEAAWGPLTLKATGRLDVDTLGRLDGELALQARNWREMLARARASGQVPGPVMTGLEQGLTVLARLNGSDETLDITLQFDRGRVSAGPLPLGEAPRLALP